jgi:FkbM family methyltransferase
MRWFVVLLHRVHRRLAALLARPTMRWALSGAPSALKVTWLRRVVLPGIAARREPVEHELASGTVFRGNTADFVPLVVQVFGRWEPAMTAFLTSRLAAGRVFVDVGANIGWFDLLAAPLVGPSGGVVAIEASPAIYRELVAQVERNGLRNVRVVNTAVGAAEGWVQVLAGPGWNSAQSAVAPGPRQPGSVRCAPLGSLLRAEEIAACRVIKIDVEGFEYEVVRGMAPLLDALPDDAEIVVEVGPGTRGAGGSVDELWTTFTARGFAGFELPNEYTARFLREPVVPTTLRRLAAPPQRQTDVVFSRAAEVRLDGGVQREGAHGR